MAALVISEFRNAASPIGTYAPDVLPLPPLVFTYSVVLAPPSDLRNNEPTGAETTVSGDPAPLMILAVPMVMPAAE